MSAIQGFGVNSVHSQTAAGVAQGLFRQGQVAKERDSFRNRLSREMAKLKDTAWRERFETVQDSAQIAGDAKVSRERDGHEALRDVYAHEVALEHHDQLQARQLMVEAERAKARRRMRPAFRQAEPPAFVKNAVHSANEPVASIDLNV